MIDKETVRGLLQAVIEERGTQNPLSITPK